MLYLLSVEFYPISPGMDFLDFFVTYIDNDYSETDIAGLAGALRKLVPRSDGSSFSDIVVLMDMPGLYLHPQLLSRFPEDFRSVVMEEKENIQFNSSALIDKATAEELFMLMPSEQLKAKGSNHLVKVSD